MASQQSLTSDEMEYLAQRVAQLILNTNQQWTPVASAPPPTPMEVQLAATIGSSAVQLAETIGGSVTAAAAATGWTPQHSGSPAATFTTGTSTAPRNPQPAPASVPAAAPAVVPPAAEASDYEAVFEAGPEAIRVPRNVTSEQVWSRAIIPTGKHKGKTYGEAAQISAYVTWIGHNVTTVSNHHAGLKDFREYLVARRLITPKLTTTAPPGA